jgi:uncharacterized repeat protein (TIGR04052 family)
MKTYVEATVMLTASLAIATLVGSSLSTSTTAAQTQLITIRFVGKVGDRPFACGQSYPLGQPAAMVTPTDFRFYVSDVTLIDATGKAAPLTLTQDRKWQYQTVALLDFENKSGACANGTTDTRDQVTGTVPQGNYKGLKFTLGIPFKLNHADATLASSPLNLTSLWWNWQFGYKFLRIDLQNRGTAQRTKQMHKLEGHGGSMAPGPHTQDSKVSKGFAIHIGSTGCKAETASQMPSSCSNPNTGVIEFPAFVPTQNVVIADLAALVANSDLSRNQPKTPPGCMSEPGDQDCAGIMTNLGVSFGNKVPAKQTFFRVE